MNNAYFVVGEIYENQFGKYRVEKIFDLPNPVTNDVETWLKAKYVEVNHGSEKNIDEFHNIRLNSAENIDKRIKSSRSYNNQLDSNNVVNENPEGLDRRKVIDWENYNKWNKVICEHFLSKENELIYLDIDDSRLESLFENNRTIFGEENDFEDAVRSTLETEPAPNFIRSHFERLETWKKNDYEDHPPFLGLLAFFCYAAQKMSSSDGVNANNYILRLTQLVYGIKTPNDNQKKYVRRGFNNARKFWDEYKKWLVFNEGSHGISSASPIYNWVHVGLPMSQILLREVDRDKLEKFFIDIGLGGGMDVPVTDIERLLAEWIPINQYLLSKTLVNYWNKKDLKIIIATIVKQELENWNSSTQAERDDGLIARNKPIKLIIQGATEYGEGEINIFALVQMGESSESMNLTSYEKSSGIPMLREDIDEVQITNHLSVKRNIGTSWSYPLERVSIPDLLLTEVYMIEDDNLQGIKWTPQPLLVFGLDDKQGVYIQQERLKIGNKSVVMVNNSRLPKVKPILEQLGLDQYLFEEGIKGVPFGWTMFYGFELTSMPTVSYDDEYSALFPVVRSNFEFDGTGIKLPGLGLPKFSIKDLPNIKITSLDDISRLKLTLFLEDKEIDEEEGSPVKDILTCGKELNVDLSQLYYEGILSEGRYRAEVEVEKYGEKGGFKPLFVKRFEMFSSDQEVYRDKGLNLAHCSNNILWMFSATEVKETDLSEENIVINGSIINKDSEELTASDVILPLTLLPDFENDDVEFKNSEEENPEGFVQPTTPSLTFQPNCINTPHVWEIQGQGKNELGICSICNSQKYFRPTSNFYGYPTPNNNDNTKSVASASSSSSSELITKTSENLNINTYDSILEALFIMGSGSWYDFKTITSRKTNFNRFDINTLSMLSSLGHIDVEIDISNFGPINWKVCPLVFNWTETNSVFLSGRSSSSDLGNIKNIISTIDGVEFTRKRNLEGPTQYFIRGLNSLSVLESVVNSFNNTREQKAKIAKHPASNISNALLPIQQILDGLPTTTAPYEAEKYNFSGYNFQKSVNLESDGLYRVNREHVKKYLFKLSGNWKRVSYWFGVYIASRLNRTPVMKYDHKRQMILCQKTTPLPGLYERVAVLCSGLVPQKTHNQIIYKNVSPAIYSQIYNAFYKFDKPSNE